MIMQAVGRNTSALVAVMRQRIAFRAISTTQVALGGGGHHHEPVPVYIPKPGSLDWYFCKNKSTRASEPEPYKPGKDDYSSYFMALAFVGLTVAAVIYKTDTFGSKPHKATGKISGSQEWKAAVDAPLKPEGPKSIKPVDPSFKPEQEITAPTAISSAELAGSDYKGITERVKEAASSLTSSESSGSSESDHAPTPSTSGDDNSTARGSKKDSHEQIAAKDAPIKPEGDKSVKPAGEKAKPLGSGESNISNEGTKGDRNEVNVTTETNEVQ